MMDNDVISNRVPINSNSAEKVVDLDAYLSSSSTSLSDLDAEHPADLRSTAPVTTTLKKKKSKWNVYDTIGKYLLKNRFYLTALEFYTELLENGDDLPRLREYFSNPTNFEGNSGTSYHRHPSFLRHSNNFGDDSISLGGGAGGNGDFLLRTSSSQTFDSTSIDNVTRYSEDIDFTNGATTNAGIEQRFNDERVAVLEFELRKARDTIQELRQTLTFDSADDQQQHSKKTEKHSTTFALSNVGQTNSPFPVRPFERRTLNYLINEYLLSNNYKLTSVTFGEENESSDLEDWDSVGLNCSRPPDLIQLYRSFCHQLNLEENKPHKIDVAIDVNFDEDFHKNHRELKEILQQTRVDLHEHKKRLEQIEEEKLHLNEEIQRLKHEKNNLLIQLELLQNHSDNEVKIEQTIQLNCSRNLSTTYRRQFERDFLTSNRIDEDVEFNTDQSEDIVQQLNSLSLDQNSLLDLILKTVRRMDSYLHGEKKFDLVPLIIYAAILHPKATERDQLLKILFNLYKKPSIQQRQVLLHACLSFARQTGPLRVHAELLPQCWENLNHKFDERRCLVAEACGILTPHLSKDIRVSLIFSMLQQMLFEDKCEQVRAACSQSLAMVINEIDDESRLSQCIDLLDRCLLDTPEVVQTTRRYLLPSIGMWCLELNKLYPMLIEHYLIKLEGIVQDPPRLIQMISILTDLIVFLFASALKTMRIDEDSPSASLRVLPEGNPSEFYQFQMILSSQADSLLQRYDQNAINGEFPFDEQMQISLDDFLKRSFETMLSIDLTNGKVVHACSEFIKTISRYLGRNFWKLKIKPIYSANGPAKSPDESQRKEAPFVLYATGVLSSWTTEQERAELTQYLYDALLLVANQKLSIHTLQAIYGELGSDGNFQETLLNILRDSLTNTNPQVRLYTLQLFNVILTLVDHSIISHKIVPALITLASDDEITVRTGTIGVFGSILVQCSEAEILERVYAQFQMFDSDSTFRDEHRVQSEFIKTFTQIAPHVETRFREEFILPFLALIASQNSQQQSERGQAKRLEIATYLFEAYSALSCSPISAQSILNSFLPGLYCLRVDFAQLRPDSVAVLDSIIKDLEHKLEQHRQDSSLLIAGSNLNQENIRGRMLKGLTTFRDSTEKLTYRFMKKK